MLTEDKRPTPEKVSEAFTAVLKKWLGGRYEGMLEDPSKGPDDFCDANMAMDRALRDCGLTQDDLGFTDEGEAVEGFNEDNGQLDWVNDLWNATILLWASQHDKQTY